MDFNANYLKLNKQLPYISVKIKISKYIVKRKKVQEVLKTIIAPRAVSMKCNTKCVL